MAATHESQNTFWRTNRAESSYGTKSANSVTAVRILTTDKEPWSTTQDRADDTATANGSDIAENTYITMNKSSKSFTEEFNFTDIGYVLLDTLGSISTSGSGANKTHTITPQSMSSSRAAKSRTYGEKLGGLMINIFTSGVIQSLSISGAKNGRIQVQYSVEGNGKFDQDPSGYNEPSLSTVEFGYSQQCTVNFNDGGSIDTDHTCSLESWAWNLNNNVTIDHRACAAEFETGNPEAGTVASEALIGARDYTFNFTYRLTDSADPMKTAMKTGTEFAVTNTIVSTTTIPTSSPSTPYSLTLSHSKAKITEIDYKVVDGFNCVVGTAKLLASGGSLPFEAALINNTTSYTS